MVWAANDSPRIRFVEAFPVKLDGKVMVCLRDPEGVVDEIPTLTMIDFFIASRLDGKNTLKDIQADFFREFGRLLSMEQIQELLHTLDKQYFLDSKRFHHYCRSKKKAFEAGSTRTAAHAQAVYSANPEECRKQLDGYFLQPDGFGREQRLAGLENLRGIVAPHIDYLRGGVVYSWAYGTLKQSKPHDLYILLGTCHRPLPLPFCVCLKDFETPFGTAPVDRLFGERLLKGHSVNFQEGQWEHRQEHSLEFQAVFLKYLFPEPDAFQILPILCGPVPTPGETQLEKYQHMLWEEFLEALLARTQETQRTVCFIAGADLAHMGPRFGDAQPVDAGLLAWLQAADLELLQMVEQINAQGFSEIITREQDRRRICGHSPIYALLRTCGARQGKLLRYGQAADPDGSQVVSFASMAFY